MDWTFGLVPLASVATVLALVVRQKLLNARRHRQATHAYNEKVVWITGASSGIGRALAVELASRGAFLILSGRDGKRLAETQKACEKSASPDSQNGQRVKTLIVDLDSSNPELVSKTAEAWSLFSTVDIFINNAGISSRGSVMDTNLETNEKLMKVNYFSAVALTKGLLPAMKNRASGHFVYISSVQGRIGTPFRAPYAASKHALQAFVDSLRSEITMDGIFVTCISPGYVNTSLSVNAVTGDGTAYGQTDPTTAAGMSAEALAQDIAIAVANKDNDLVVANITAKIGIYLRTLVPDVYFWAMSRRAMKAQSTSIKQD